MKKPNQTRFPLEDIREEVISPVTYASLAEFEKALALLLEAPFASWRGSFSFLTALVNRAGEQHTNRNEIQHFFEILTLTRI
jgi:hypothetical protein